MIIDLLVAELRRDEGVRYTIYLDSRGIKTTGVGHNCQVSPLPPSWTFPLNDEQVNQLLTGDLSITFAGLDKHLPWWCKLDDVRQRVIATMAFNLGVEGLLAFHATLFAIQDGAYSAAAAHMRTTLWYRQIGARGERLSQAMQTGVMPIYGGIA